ncbi:MAG: single-stranded DNA-binding protein [Leptolyngbyaceae cyanobacterium MO_188.B28]|nr:single-stranded DNA-binding protein [Leptolyngbyaceae cyanobacterium MO_188.B28]
MNNYSAIGHLGSDAQTRYFESGKAIVEFSIAIDQGKDPQGNDRPPTWVPVKHWLRDGSRLPEFLTKGAHVGISGRLEQERWQDRETGAQRSKLVCIASRIDLLGSKSDTPSTGTQSPAYPAVAPTGTGWDGGPNVEF